MIPPLRIMLTKYIQKSKILAHFSGEHWPKKYQGVPTKIAAKDGGIASQIALLEARGLKQKTKG